MNKALVTFLISVGCTLPIQASTIFFTQIGSPDVFFATFSPAGSGTVTGVTTIGSSPNGADGILIGPNGTLFFAGEASNGVFQIKQNGIGVPVFGAGTTESFFLATNQNAPDPSNTTLFTFNNAGSIAALPVVAGVLQPGTVSAISGPDKNVSDLFWSSTNQVFYLTGNEGTTGDLGVFNIATHTTSAPLFTNIPTAQEAIFDPFTGLIILFGDGQVDTYNPATNALGAPVLLPGATAGTTCGGGPTGQLDAGTVDGAGHAYVAGCGNLYYIDYSSTHDILSLSNIRESVPVAGGIKDVAVIGVATPEPSTVTMVLIGLAGLGIRLRRKQRA
jgi:hypothetical protein